MSSAKSTDSDDAVTPTQASTSSSVKLEPILSKTDSNGPASSDDSTEGLIIGIEYIRSQRERAKKGNVDASNDKSSSGSKGEPGDGDTTPTQG